MRQCYERKSWTIDKRAKEREWGLSEPGERKRRAENLVDNRLSEQNANCDSDIFWGRTLLKEKGEEKTKRRGRGELCRRG